MNILDRMKPLEVVGSRHHRQVTAKRQIVLRHTGLVTGMEGDLPHALQGAGDRKQLAAVVIHRNGTPYQCFSSSYWAEHLGVKARDLSAYGYTDAGSRGQLLNQQSVAVEMDSAGGLLKYRGVWYVLLPAAAGGHQEPDLRRPLSRGEVQEYPGGFDGFEAYQRYTPDQLETLGQVLNYWCAEWVIPDSYRENMWARNLDALSSEPGIWTQASYRGECGLLHKQPELVDLLQNGLGYAG